MPALSKAEFEARSEFRYRLTCFLRFGEQVAQAQGITFAHYLLLLHTKGMPGRSWALVGELAERLQLRQHSAVELVTRCEAAGLVERRRSEQDRREVQIHLTRAGQRALQHIAAAQSDELSWLRSGLGLDKRGLPRPRPHANDCDASAAAAKNRPHARK